MIGLYYLQDNRDDLTDCLRLIATVGYISTSTSLGDRPYKPVYYPTWWAGIRGNSHYDTGYNAYDAETRKMVERATI